MSVSFVPVVTPAQRQQLSHLAKRIWFGYWPALIGADQTAYMVERFQSLEAIERDMALHGYEYWLIEARDDDAAESQVVGYTGGCAEPSTSRFFISKIYLLPEARGRGTARTTVEFYERLARERGLSALYLTVNKGNELGIRAYRGTGFRVVEAVVSDIGQGYVMDDYIMQKDLG
ncbi:GNAT family N-acetyltransferase [Berryella wangjianweii]|uniref:GNAT family N-acetyltransferase n=1 Tax=Berryella wangjianweii TaxID=2734634 RepID=A0A6M8J866_9ACTN|nr:GNAT family N-acetyltransferase [Berryella wangjianweii]QKF07688.1 GNAT family N-acetyltransferase [Berryella wangjianweii]